MTWLLDNASPTLDANLATLDGWLASGVTTVIATTVTIGDQVQKAAVIGSVVSKQATLGGVLNVL